MERPNRPSIIIRYRPLEFIYHPEILREKEKPRNVRQISLLSATNGLGRLVMVGEDDLKICINKIVSYLQIHERSVSLEFRKKSRQFNAYCVFA